MVWGNRVSDRDKQRMMQATYTLFASPYSQLESINTEALEEHPHYINLTKPSAMREVL
jgi:hypothetical protein